MKKVFIDGSLGTTGLRIRERLGARRDLEVIELGEAERKDESARRARLEEADITFLCLPDEAARAAASTAPADKIIIDTSTAHRTSDDWTYGFPEIAGLRDKIRSSHRIANPGCHASGFIALVAPLVELGLLSRSAKLNCTSLTGYSGGGKSMIADYRDPAREDALRAPRAYGLSQSHKHLPEMAKVCGLETEPTFLPIVSSYYSGMVVSVQLFADDVGGIDAVRDAYRGYYRGGVVRYADGADEGGFFSAEALSGSDRMEITAFGNSDRILLASRFDNLGKGASGAAIQNMNIVLGIDETLGLDIE